MKVVGVIGYHNAGKTSVVEDLIKYLKEKGLSVSTAKSSTHEINPDKDTERHFAMGAEKVVGVDPNLFHILKKKGDLFRELLGCDYAILEGFKKRRGYMKVLVAQDEKDLELVDDYTFIVTGNEELEEAAQRKGAVFIKDSHRLYEKIESSAFRKLPEENCKRCGRRKCSELAREIFEGTAKDAECTHLTDQVLLEVDGKAVTLSPFVQDVVDKTVRGLVGTLRNGEGKEIRLELR
jgi:molybdopterin-guanine dinucleotide biosynthesis protein MobB